MKSNFGFSCDQQQLYIWCRLTNFERKRSKNCVKTLGSFSNTKTWFRFGFCCFHASPWAYKCPTEIVSVINSHLGKPLPTKTDEFSEMFQTTVDPPPSFSKNHVADFFQNSWPKYPFIMAKICNINFWIGNDPPPPSELFRKFIRFGRDKLP